MRPCSIPSGRATEHIAALNSLKIAGLAVLGALLFAVPAAIGMAQVQRGTAPRSNRCCCSRLSCPASSTAWRL